MLHNGSCCMMMPDSFEEMTLASLRSDTLFCCRPVCSRSFGKRVEIPLKLPSLLSCCLSQEGEYLNDPQISWAQLFGREIYNGGNH